MKLEIERKYLVSSDWMTDQTGQYIRQGYLLFDPQKVVRVRTIDHKGILTIKSSITVMSRQEFEFEIPFEDAMLLLTDHCLHPPILKTRYSVFEKDHIWTVDQFHDQNKGLILAEIELEKEDETFDIPDWIEKEVTEDPRFLNANLYHNPFYKWNH